MSKTLRAMIARLDEAAATAALVLIVAITAGSVFMRYVLNSPLKWTEEATLILIVVVTFLGSSAVFRKDGHVSIDFFVSRMPEPVRRIIDIINHLIMIAVCAGVFVWLGIRLAMQAGDKLTPVLHISYTWIDLAVVICGLFSMIRLVGSLVKLISGR